ncbi:MAG: hypothetical protein WAM81_10965 [Acidimicrobiia bacterium]
MAVEQSQSHQFVHAAPFEFVEANEPFKDENTLVAMRGLGEWGLSLNPAAVVVELPAEIPLNLLTEETMARGFLLAQHEVE